MMTTISRDFWREFEREWEKEWRKEEREQENALRKIGLKSRRATGEMPPATTTQADTLPGAQRAWAGPPNARPPPHNPA